MKKTLILFVILGFFNNDIFSQINACNINSDGIAISGYDVVSYFDNKAKKGSAKHQYTYKDIVYYFSSDSNCEKFKLNPEIYLPQYGGWCAYAMGKTGKKVEMDPKTFEIRDGKLYLFYKSFFTNTYKNWISEGVVELRNNADINWKKINN